MGDKILLCKRGIQPRYGLWTLPAGYMENSETTQQGAARETYEETGSHVDIGELYALFNLPHINQVYLMYHATLSTHDYGPTPESLEVKLFSEEEIPWDELAFPVITETLRRYFADRTQQRFGLQTGSILPRKAKM